MRCGTVWCNLVMAACMLGLLEIATDAQLEDEAEIIKKKKEGKCMLMHKLFTSVNIVNL